MWSGSEIILIALNTALKDKLHNFQSPPNCTKAVTSRKIVRLAEHVVCSGQMSDAYRTSVWKTRMKETVEGPDDGGTIILI